jgi:cytochrome b561
MENSVNRDDYNAGAKWLHWLIALLIIALFPLGWVMGDFTGVQKAQAYNLHKSLGATVLMLMALRLVWRGVSSAPALPATMPPREQLLAKLGHLALYALAIALPLTGWALISTSERPSLFFGTPFPLIPFLAELPVAEKKEYHEALEQAHELLANGLIALIALHVLAALRHAFILKDGVLSRMMPRFGQSSKALPAE